MRLDRLVSTPSPVVMVRLLRITAASVVAGLLLARLLLGSDPSYPLRGALVGGEWWSALFAITSVLLGWLSSLLVGGRLCILVGAAAPVMAIETLIAVKVLVWPQLPGVSDAFAMSVPLLQGITGGSVALVLQLVRPSSHSRTVIVLLLLLLAALVASAALTQIVGS